MLKKKMRSRQILRPSADNLFLKMITPLSTPPSVLGGHLTNYRYTKQEEREREPGFEVGVRLLSLTKLPQTATFL